MIHGKVETVIQSSFTHQQPQTEWERCESSGSKFLHVVRSEELKFIYNTFTWETPNDENVDKIQRILYSMKEYHVAETHIQHAQPTQ